MNISQENLKEFVIEKLTELLIKNSFEEKKIGKKIYIRKEQCYKDLIKLIKIYL